jgi:DNA processing protein
MGKHGPDNGQDKAEILDAMEITLVPGIGAQGQARLRHMCGTMSQPFSMTKAQLAGAGIPPESAVSLTTRRYREMAEEIYDWAMREECRILLLGKDPYPILLSEIHEAPLILYLRGDVNALSAPAVAIVGTRRPTLYGLQIAEGLAADLASGGVTVVSGLARGVDGAAHRGCLKAGGKTIAVFGCGIDIFYPREHRRMAEEIMENGLLISEFPPGTSPSPQNFPVRNRIISGLALGTLIIEASEYSGSLITARLALEQNREVFAIPGNLTSPQSFGPNFLIKQGAKLVQSWRDIAEELPAGVRASLLVRELNQAEKSRELNLLSDEEQQILTLIPADYAIQFDRLYVQCRMEISSLGNILTNLEMHGWIRQIPGNLYVRLLRPG